MTTRRQLLGECTAIVAALALARTVPVTVAEAVSRKADPRLPFAQRLADIVIPRTDTPGGADVDTGIFLLMAIDQQVGSMRPDQLERVRGTLDAANGGDFMKAPAARQEALLAKLDERAFSGTPKAGTPEEGWTHLKAAILVGYYTSEAGASKELRYDPVPGTRKNITIGPDFRMFSNEGFGGSL